MTQRKKKPFFHEPSLVPLADMLTNTVGVVVFILVFTVLTAGGAVVAKRLPMVHEVEQTRTSDYICAKGKIYPLRDTLIDTMLKEMGEPSKSESGFKEFANKVNGKTVEDEHMKLVLKAAFASFPFGYRIDFEIVCHPKPKAGLAAGDVAAEKGFFQKDLSALNAKETLLIFWVQPDGITSFRAARDLAAAGDFSVNWRPRTSGDAMTIGLGGGRGTAKLHGQ
jgi:hypothetical protein